MVDVVDENDNILHPVYKEEAHQKGLLHRTVISEIKDSAGRWVLIKQSSGKQDAGQFVSAIGGHVQAGETEEEALAREAQEETGLTNVDYKLIGKVISKRNVLDHQENHYFILYEIYSDQNIQLNEESQECRLFTEEELRNSLKQTPAMFGTAFHLVVKTFYPQLLG